MTNAEAKMIAQELFNLLEKNNILPDRTLTVGQAASLLCVSKQTIYNNIEEIPHTKIGKRLLFSERKLREYINR